MYSFLLVYYNNRNILFIFHQYKSHYLYFTAKQGKGNNVYLKTGVIYNPHLLNSRKASSIFEEEIRIAFFISMSDMLKQEHIKIYSA